MTSSHKGFRAKVNDKSYVIVDSAFLEQFSDIVPLEHGAKVYRKNKNEALVPIGAFWRTMPDDDGYCILVDWLY